MSDIGLVNELSKCLETEGNTFVMVLKSEEIKTDKDKRRAIELIRDYGNLKHQNFVKEMKKIADVTGMAIEVNSIIKIL